jgi:hypothetical protein
MAEDQKRFKISMPIVKTRSKLVKDENGTEKEVRYVEGIASNTSIDLHGDRMAPSAIKSMADSLKYHAINLNDSHDKGWSREIGDIVELEVTENDELKLTAELSEMSVAKDLWYALTEKQKKLGLSIGGYVKDYEVVEEEDSDGEARWVRVFKDVELDHVAVTNSPANPKTWVDAISKSVKNTEKDIELFKAIKEEVKQETSEKEMSEEDKEQAQKVRKIRDKFLTLFGSNVQKEREVILDEVIKDGIDLLREFLGESFMENSSSLETEDVAKNVASEVESAEEEKESVTPENEGKEPEAETTPTEETKEEAKAETEETVEEVKSDEGADTQEETEEETEPETTEEVGETTEETSEEEEAEVETEAEKEVEAETEKNETETEVEESEEKPEEVVEEKTEKSLETTSSEEVTKAVDDLLNVVKELNERLDRATQEIEALKEQPSERKVAGVPVGKGFGSDSDGEVEKSVEELEADLEKELAAAEKKYANTPNLFSIKQRIRSKYKALGVE